MQSCCAWLLEVYTLANCRATKKGGALVQQLTWVGSSYNHNTLTTLRSSVTEPLQMHFKVAVRNFIQAGDSLIDVSGHYQHAGYTVEPPKMDSPYYGNLHNADKSPRSRIIPYTIVYVHKETSVLRTPLK